MPSMKAEESSSKVQFIENEIKEFVRTSPLNRIPESNNSIFEEPLVQYADGNDSLFSEYKTIIDPTHLTPREAMAKTFNRSPEDFPANLSVISWVLPITGKTRESNRRQTHTPSRLWILTRWYGEEFNDAMRQHVVRLITDMGYLATAPVLQPYFKALGTNEQGIFSNWSERHIAYVAGLGTFSLSDGFITEHGIAHRCGSVVTDLVLPASSRTAKSHYSNCLFYINATCRVCIARCPSGAITENGHDKPKCLEYINSAEFRRLKEKYNADHIGCGLCQTKVPCESRNPTQAQARKTE